MAFWNRKHPSPDAPSSLVADTDADQEIIFKEEFEEVEAPSVERALSPDEQEKHAWDVQIAELEQTVEERTRQLAKLKEPIHVMEEMSMYPDRFATAISARERTTKVKLATELVRARDQFFTVQHEAAKDEEFLAHARYERVKLDKRQREPIPPTYTAQGIGAQRESLVRVWSRKDGDWLPLRYGVATYDKVRGEYTVASVAKVRKDKFKQVMPLRVSGADLETWQDPQGAKAWEAWQKAIGRVVATESLLSDYQAGEEVLARQTAFEIAERMADERKKGEEAFERIIAPK